MKPLSDSINERAIFVGFSTDLYYIKGYRTRYFNTQKLFTKLRMSKADQTYLKLMKTIKKMDLIIHDDFGLEPLDRENRLMLLEILEDRHGRKSTLIAS